MSKWVPIRFQFSNVSAALMVFVSAIAHAEVSVLVDPSIRYQIMEGFGATHITLTFGPANSVDYLGSENRDASIKMVYREVGLNLGGVERLSLETTGRGAQAWDKQANDNDDPELIDSDGFDFEGIDDVEESLLVAARPLGFTDYYPASKLNLKYGREWLSELRTTDYEKYLLEAAENVVAPLIYYRDRYGVDQPFVQIFNEPTSGNRELPGASTQEIVDLVKAVGARLQREGFADTKLVVPNEETVKRSLDVARAILNDSEARQYVGAIGYHIYPYGSPYASVTRILTESGSGVPVQSEIDVRRELSDLASQYGLPVWMTETSHGGVDPRSYDSFRARAIHIHDELNYANASAYFGMLNIWEKQAQTEHNPAIDFWSGSTEGTFVHVDRDADDAVTLLGMGYAVGHYSRWLGPGAVRLEATASDALVKVSAFDYIGQLTLVIINNADFSQSASVHIPGALPSLNFIGERSTPSAYWQSVAAIPLGADNRFEIELPAKSVTTLSSGARRTGNDVVGCRLTMDQVLGRLSGNNDYLNSCEDSSQENAYRTVVQKMYIAYYGRPGDPAGIDFWINELASRNGDLSAIIDAFGTSVEFTDRYSGLADEELVNNIYEQLFGRDAETDGLRFYVERLRSGEQTLGSIALNIADGIREGTSDYATVMNKLEAATAFTALVHDRNVEYGPSEISGAKEIIDSVDATVESVDVAISLMSDFLSE